MTIKAHLSGVYSIIHISSGRRYVGSSVYLNRRRSNHFSSLRKGKHQNDYLQKTFTKYGESDFSWEILEYITDRNDLIKTEQKWIDFYQAANHKFGFNLSPNAGNTKGVRPSAETRALISQRVRDSGRVVAYGEKHSISILTNAQAKEILYRLANGETQESLAGEYLITREAISRLKLRKNWKSIELTASIEKALKTINNNKGIHRMNGHAKLTRNEVLLIKSRLLRGDSTPIIAKDFGKPLGTIGAIKRGKKYKSIVPFGPLPGEAIRLRKPKVFKKPNMYIQLSLQMNY